MTGSGTIAIERLNLYEEVLNMESVQIFKETERTEERVRLSLERRTVLFAGSRYGSVSVVAGRN